MARVGAGLAQRRPRSQQRLLVRACALIHSHPASVAHPACADLPISDTLEHERVQRRAVCQPSDVFLVHDEVPHHYLQVQ
jgi:hypothetical protein